MIYLMFTVCLLFGRQASSFVANPRFGGIHKPHVLLNPLSATEVPRTAESLAGREFQLEEREDRDSELTEIWLNVDGSVTLGETDGPEVKSYIGKWNILETAREEDKPFRLTLDRTYGAGDHTGKTDVGEFDYNVKREFWGNIGMVGESVEVEGVIHGLDERDNVDCEVGFFALIDSEAEGVKGERTT